MRKIASLAALVSSICLISECVVGQTVSRQDTVFFELSKPIADPTNFNWFTRNSLRENGAHQAMWEPLFLLNYKTGKLDPWLGIDIKRETDATHDVWTLTLRKDVEWSDSTPGNKQRFTSDDVVVSVNMALNNDLPALEAITLRSQVDSVKAQGDYQVIFTLKGKYPRFALENFAAGMFSSFLIMPSHIWKGQDPNTFKFSQPIGTGPYKLGSSTKQSVAWIRNDNWWGPKLDASKKPLQLVWQATPTTSQSKADLIANKLDAAREYSLDDFNDVKSQNGKIVGWTSNSQPAWNDPCVRQIDINTKRAPFSDPNVRQALSYLIDRAQLAHNAYADTTTPSRTMFPEYGAMRPLIDAVVNKGYGLSPNADATKAQTSLNTAGYTKDPTDGVFKKGGQELAATLRVNSDVPKDVAGASEVGKQLNAQGIKVKVEAIPNNEYWGKAVPTGDYDMVYGWLSCGSVAEPFTSMNRYAADKSVPLGARSPGFNNTGRWDDQAAKDYSAVVLQIGALPLGDAGIPNLVVGAYKSLAAEMPFIPLVQSPTIIPFNTTYWTGWPAVGGDTVPMHSWAATHRIIHELRKVP